MVSQNYEKYIYRTLDLNNIYGIINIRIFQQQHTYKSTLRGFLHFRYPIERNEYRFSRHYDTYNQIASKINRKKKNRPIIDNIHFQIL